MKESIYENETSEVQINNEGTRKWDVERIEIGNGIRTYLKGASFPIKGYPVPNALFACNIVKRLVVESIGKIIPLSTKKGVAWFSNTSWKAINPYILKEEYRQQSTNEIIKLISNMLIYLKIEDNNFAKIVAHIFEYDTAYMVRLQDMATSTSKEKLLSNLRKEISRLFELMIEREIQHSQMKDKIRKFKRVAILLLFIPKIKNAILYAVKLSDFNKLQFDDTDQYWAYHRTDYQIAGIPYKERIEYLKSKGYSINEGQEVK